MENSTKKIISYIKNPKVIVVIFIFILSIVYIFGNNLSQNFIKVMAEVLALPSFIISLDVLHTVKITPETLNSYSKLRDIDNITKLEKKDRAKTVFSNDLSEIKNLKNRCRTFFYNKQGGLEIANTVVNDINSKKNKFYEFFIDTEEYIFLDYLNFSYPAEIRGTKPNAVSEKLLSKEGKEKLLENLKKLNKINLANDSLNEECLEVVELLFSNDGLMENYLDICSCAYDSMDKE